jgi:predicted regulator of amino acid metabolism with ACT domain
VSDEDIENDGVSDDEEEESDSFVAEEINLASAVSQLKEVAAGMVIRDKGKFLPLDDIEVVELKTAKLLDTARKAVAAEATTVKRKNVFGKIRAAE